MAGKPKNKSRSRTIYHAVVRAPYSLPHDPDVNVTVDSGTNAAGVQPAPSEHVRRFIEEVEALNRRLDALLIRSVALADGLFGETPMAGLGSTAAPKPSGKVAEMDLRLISAHASVGFIDKQLARLENL